MSEELPEGWILTSVDSLASVASGRFLKRTEYQPQPDPRNKYPVAGAGGPIGWSHSFNEEGPVTTLGRVGACGSLNHYDAAAWVTDNALVVKPAMPEMRRYIERFCETVPWQDLNTGTSQPLITQTLVRSLAVPVAPLAEQHRIVAQIEELLQGVERARARLTKAQAILKRFRQSVLAAACSGELTREWRAARGDSETYPTVPLRDVISELGQGWSPQCENFASKANDSWGVIKTTAVQAMSFVASENKQLPAALRPRPDMELKAGDLLITRAGPRGTGMPHSLLNIG